MRPSPQPPAGPPLSHSVDGGGGRRTARSLRPDDGKVTPGFAFLESPIRFPRVPDSLSCGEAMPPSADADARGSRRMCGSVAMVAYRSLCLFLLFWVMDIIKDS